MKKLLLLMIVVLSYSEALAQADILTVGMSGFISGEDTMFGPMVNANKDLVEIKPLNAHLVFSTISFFERFTPSKEGTVVQSYLGFSIRNQDATLLGGPLIGAINHGCHDITKTELSLGGQIFAQTCNGGWTIWGAFFTKGYFAEVWRSVACFEKTKIGRCELQLGGGTMKTNYAALVRFNFKNAYVFFGKSLKVYEPPHNGEKMHFTLNRMHAGTFIEVGGYIPYKKKTATCEGCN